MGFFDALPKKVPRPGKVESSGVFNKEDILDENDESIDVDLSELEALESNERPVMMAASTEASPDHPDRNEDAHFLSKEKKIAMVADGMGSVPGGELASLIAGHVVGILSEVPATGKEAEVTKSLIEYASKDMDLGKAKKFFSEENAVATQAEAEESFKTAFKLMDSSITAWKNHDPDIMKRVEDSARQKGGENEEALKKEIKRNFDTLGTTATMMKVWKDAEGKKKVTMGSVGDSRIYRLRNGEMKRMTRDDSFIQALSDAGLIGLDDAVDKAVKIEDIKKALAENPQWRDQPDMKRNCRYLDTLASLNLVDLPIRKIRNQMLQNLGGAERVKKEFNLDLEPNLTTDDAMDGDLYLSCTDGVLDNLTDKEIAEITKGASDPDAVSNLLTKRAKMKSISDDPAAKKDDITAVVMAI